MYERSQPRKGTVELNTEQSYKPSKSGGCTWYHVSVKHKKRICN